VRALGPEAWYAKIFVMRADGSDVHQLRNSADAEWYAAWSPDGQRIAFRRVVDSLGGPKVAGIYTMSADGSEITRAWWYDNCSDSPCHLVGDQSQPAWSPDGSRLAFSSNHVGFFVPETATLYTPYRIYVVNVDGSDLVATNPVTDSLMLPHWYPAWSPDGTKIAFASERAYSWYRAPGHNDDIYVMNPDGSGVVRLTDSPVEETWPAWSPDGRRIAFERRSDDRVNIYVMNADGTGIVPLTTGSGHTDFQPSWSPDGTRIVFTSDRGGNFDIYVINVDGTGLTRLTDDPADDLAPTWAPQKAP
jgi:TolB protein